jgi:hypothetical protein
MSDELDIKFNIIPTAENLPIEKKPEKSELTNDGDHAINDFMKARENMLSVLEVGTKAVKELGDFAYQTQAPETYMALAKMITAMSDGTNKMMQLHKQLEELRNNPTSSQPGEVQNNLFLVGSTHELAQALKAIK